MRIGVDIDNTLHDFFGQLQESLSQEGITINDQEALVYGSWDQLKNENNLESFERCHNDECIDKAVLFKGAVEALEDLSKRGHKLFFISSRPKSSRDATERWLKKVKLGSGELVISERGSNKREELKTYQLDLIIDDDPGVIAAALCEGIIVGCLEKPWNQNFRAVNQVIMAKDWGELKNRLDEVIEDPPKSFLGKVYKHLLP